MCLSSCTQRTQADPSSKGLSVVTDMSRDLADARLPLPQELRGDPGNCTAGSQDTSDTPS